MKCVICGREPADWQCGVCGRIVCGSHAQTVEGRVYCSEHAPPATPAAPAAPEKPVLKQLRSAIWTVAILLAGAVIIMYIVEAYMPKVPSVPVIESLLGFSTLLLGGLAAILAVLVIAYLALRK